METAIGVSTKKDKYITDFERNLSKDANENNFIISQRELAFKAFSELDFPSKRDENWKYTNINPVLNTHYEKSEEVDFENFETYTLATDESITLVFVNGNFNRKLSVNPVQGLIIKNISVAIKEDPELIEKYLASQSDLIGDIFPSMNTMFFNDGAFVYIPEGVVLEKPIQLVYISSNSSLPTVSYPRNLFVAAKNSGFKVVEIYQSGSENKSLVNSMTEIFVDENANVEYYKLQMESGRMCHIDTVQAVQKANSKLSVYTFTLDGSLVRNKLSIRLDGSFCETHMKGLSILKDSQHVDNHTFIDHALPNSYSNELYKNIVDENAHSVFCGKIMVRKDAQKTNAFQSCKNILLGENSVADAMPQLEIFADDVKCSHGSTTGRLNDEALFYLQSRGIGKEKAKGLLIYAFAAELLDSISIPALKSTLEKILTDKLGTEL